ncbi:PIN/TRAM domain-containing protein [Paenibacillus sp. J2TS4]|uniref:PIN/TRAM domain-containing protein n=1 Tax=Paenibacillus sp. J2TS4 TaxID=2807194 RepID=UPI001B2990CE|nr:PIN/TRAM domain-containing protein [Paenibacillus sp. J2TS4]GIP36232.1 putative PIN and TRAM-domain containing protein YacL [Paenibacillus sp. J2TS4]
MKLWVQIFGAIIGGIMGFQWNGYLGEGALQWLQLLLGQTELQGQVYWMIGMGAAAGYAVALFATLSGRRFLHREGSGAGQMPLPELLTGIAGMLIGLLIAVLLFPSLDRLAGGNSVLPVAVTFLLGIGGFRWGCSQHGEFADLLLKMRTIQDPAADGSLVEEHKILDTSVIIDGRIADICKTGFIEGILVIPEFVLEELQHIADSSDLLKRNRGRRGLDILNKIQKELEVKVLIYEGDFEDISEVDSKLVRLAKLLRGKVITNDFNLNKVCELQGVSVLNINDLANAVKPVVLPGEEIMIQIIKDGKEYGQGVAYLDDGTMIVVEGGREYIGMTMEVMVTSVLQTSAGRMIFAKPKLLEKAQ